MCWLYFINWLGTLAWKGKTILWGKFKGRGSKSHGLFKTTQVSNWRANWLFSRQPAYGLNVSSKRKRGAFGRPIKIWVLTAVLFIVLYCGRVPAANAPWMHCSRRIILQTLVFSRSYLHHQVSPPETLVVKGGTTSARNDRWILPENARLPCNIQGSFTCRKSTTWDKRLYFPSEGRSVEDFFALKNHSVGFEPANFGNKGQHANSRPAKPLCCLSFTSSGIFRCDNSNTHTDILKCHSASFHSP